MPGGAGRLKRGLVCSPLKNLERVRGSIMKTYENGQTRLFSQVGLGLD